MNERLFPIGPQVIRYLRLKGKSVPPDYGESFQRALHTFQHQRVYDLDLREVIPLSPFTDDVPQETRDIYVGPYAIC
jgi:exonuclease-1